jgi:hypothetical protein
MFIKRVVGRGKSGQVAGYNSGSKERLNCSHNHGNIKAGGEENEICGSSGIQTGCSPILERGQ